MKIITVVINNYRNLDGVTIKLHPDINFIVGENNLGKSNFLDLLNTIFTRSKFNKDDFYCISKPLEIDFTLLLDDIELGIFNDLLDPTTIMDP